MILSMIAFLFLSPPIRAQISIILPSSSTLDAGAETLPSPRSSGKKKNKYSSLESVSLTEPPGLAGQFPSVNRFKIPADWKEDGVVLEKSFDQIHETGKFQLITPPGGVAEARLKKGVSVSIGDKAIIYRLSSPHEGDRAPNAPYLFEIGVAKVIKTPDPSSCILKILRADGAVEAGDLIKKEWR